jgi:hypothetical protein
MQPVDKSGDDDTGGDKTGGIGVQSGVRKGYDRGNGELMVRRTVHGVPPFLWNYNVDADRL